MFAKLVVVVISFATMGAWLLSLRHERIQALSETTQAQLRIDRKDERLWMLRTKIAQRITPPQIEQMTAGLLDLQPIAPYKALTREQLAALTDDPPVGPPGLLNPGLAMDDSGEVPGGGEASGDSPAGALAKGKASANQKGSQASSKSNAGTKSQPATKGAKPAASGKASGKASPTGGKPAAKPAGTATTPKSGSKPAPKAAPKATPKNVPQSGPKPGSKQAPKTSPTRVAKNDEKNP